MKLQTWGVYRKMDDGIVKIGEVKTSATAGKNIALDKAWHRFVGKSYAIGWELHVQKEEVNKMTTSDYEKVRHYEEYQRLKRENERLRSELADNARLLARQCDLARDAETRAAELEHRFHSGDPCIYCGIPHDEVEIGFCKGGGK